MLTLTVKEYLARYEAGENSDIMAAQIVKESGKPFAANTLVRRMKNLGYKWDNSAKVWIWTKGNEPQPLEQNLLEQIRKPDARKGGRPKKKRPSPEEVKQLLHKGELKGEVTGEVKSKSDELRGEVIGEQPSKTALFQHLAGEAIGELEGEARDEVLGEAKGEVLFTPDEVEKIRLMLSQWERGFFTSSVDVAASMEQEDLKQRIAKERSDETTRKTAILWNHAGKALDKFCENNKLNKQDVMSLAILDLIERYKG